MPTWLAVQLHCNVTWLPEAVLRTSVMHSVDMCVCIIKLWKSAYSCVLSPMTKTAQRPMDNMALAKDGSLTNAKLQVNKTALMNKRNLPESPQSIMLHKQQKKNKNVVGISENWRKIENSSLALYPTEILLATSMYKQSWCHI